MSGPRKELADSMATNYFTDAMKVAPLLHFAAAHDIHTVQPVHELEKRQLPLVDRLAQVVAIELARISSTNHVPQRRLNFRPPLLLPEVWSGQCENKTYIHGGEKEGGEKLLVAGVFLEPGWQTCKHCC